MFLGLYTFIICTRFEIDIHPAEYVLHAWCLTLIFEEIRQLIYQEPKNFLKKLEFYLSDAWNILDLISLAMFVIAAVLRYVACAKRDQNYLIAARIIFATDIALFFIRSLQIFLVNRKMGPKIVMIREMVISLNWLFQKKSLPPVEDNRILGSLNFENSRGWEEKNGKIPRGGKIFYGIPWEEKILENSR